MKILVTGGTGVIGEGAIPELIARGHAVRLFSRHANEDAKQWPGVEPFVGNVADAKSLANAAEGCDAILHIGDAGTQNLLTEAKRAKVHRLVLVSSDSAVRASLAGLNWTIVRPGYVYGPGEQGISTLLKMVRALPVMPAIEGGDEELQPLWYEDLAKVLASTLERNDLGGEVLAALGPEITTPNDLVRRFEEITGRSPARVPLPVPITGLDGGETNERARSAIEVLGVQATPLDAGLRLLADSLRENVPHAGFGAMEHKTFFADIRGSRMNAPQLMAHFREHVNEIMPIEFVAEPGAPDRVEQGATLTGKLPLRGNFQVRVEVAEPAHVVFATLEGHPLAGIVEFTSSETASGVRFAIDVFSRASNVIDWLTVRTVGALAQDANWRAVVQRMVDASGGTSEGVQQEKKRLSEDEAAAVEKRVKSLVQARKREEVRTSRTPA